MALGQSEVPALEPSGLLGTMSLPIGTYRLAFSYGDALGDPMPMTPLPSNRGSVSLEASDARRQYQHLANVQEEEATVSSPAMTLSSAIDNMDQGPRGED